jgi:S1-C subfamily serine protease
MDEETTLASRNRDEAGETASYEAKLGLQVENIDRAQLTQYRGVPSNLTGVIVTAVDPDGPARDKPMLQASNPRAGRLTVITHVDGQEVRSQSDLGRVLRDIGANEIVSLRVTLVFWNGTGQTRLNDGVVRLRVADIG